MTAPRFLPAYVIHWREPEQCLATVRSIVASRDLEVAVHIIDNSPGLLDAAADELAEMGVVVLESPANLGFAGAANLGLSHCVTHYPEAPHCLVTAHDVVLDDHCLGALVVGAADDERIAVAGPRFGTEGQVIGGRWNGRRGRWRTEAWPDDATAVDTDWLLGACLLIDTAWVRTHGGLDARLGSYVEDVDLCLRVTDSGRRVACIRDARAAEHGRSAGDVTRTVDRNTLFVAYKRAGAVGLTGTLGLTLWLALKTALAGMSPLRDAGQRTTSRQRSRAHLAAVADVARRRHELADFRRVTDPDANPIPFRTDSSLATY